MKTDHFATLGLMLSEAIDEAAAQKRRVRCHSCRETNHFEVRPASPKRSIGIPVKLNGREGEGV